MILEKYYSFLFPWIDGKQGEGKFYKVSQPSEVINHASKVRSYKSFRINPILEIPKMNCLHVIEGNLKGTVNLIWSEPPCEDGNPRFATLPYKPLSDQKCGNCVFPQ